MTKAEIRERLDKYGIRQWQLAEKLGISEYTLCKRLRQPVTGDFESAVITAIDELSSDE